jgi:acyl-CoA synthetase (AMP-forming)/AMP-acid ligase II
VIDSASSSSSALHETLPDMVRRLARLSPEAVALAYGGRETTYRGLDLLSNRVANGLLAAGVRPGSRIAILDKNNDQFFEILAGAAKVDAVLVPVNARLAPPEIAFAVKDSETEVLFVGEAFVPVISEIRDQLTTVRHIVVLGSAYEQWRDANPAHDPACPVGLDSVCLQLYTSGTTGFPKGVQLTHRNFLLSPPQGRGKWRWWTPDDALLLVMPLFHIAGVGTGIFALYTGQRIIIHREFNALDVLHAIEIERVTVAFLVPAMLLAMLGEKRCETTDLSSLKQIIYGASPIPAELLKRSLQVFSSTNFFQVYGLTETTGVITVLEPEDHREPGHGRMKSCGRAVDGVELRVVGANGEIMPRGKVGEILCRTVQNMHGYWKRGDDTARTLKDGWLRTGDVGYLDHDGYLYIHDRIKDMIVSGGENVYPAEVESALYGHSDIADVAVIGVPDERWGEAVKALVVLKQGCPADARKIMDYARDRLAGYKLPKSIDFVNELPRNPSGKILKRALRERFWKGYERQVN